MNYLENAIHQYTNANHLQDSMGGYLLMFESLLRLNGIGHKAYNDGDYETEYMVLEKNVRILLGMRAMFKESKMRGADIMYAYFSTLLEECGLFADYDDRYDFYSRMQTLISAQYQVWKKAAGR